MKKLILSILLLSVCYSNLLPDSYFLSSLNRSSITLPSNSIMDIREGINGKLYFGTSAGLGYAEFDNSNPIFHTIISNSLPRGSNPATFTYNNIVAISGVIDTAVATDNEALNESWLKTYFPTEIQKSYEKEILSHRLKNQIIATELAGSLVNRMGFAFVKMKMDKTGMSADAIARAYVIVKEICDLNQYWAKIEALDNHIDTNIQYELLIDVTRLADRLINWFLLNDDGTESIDKIVVTYKPAMDILKQSISSVLIGETKRSIQRRNRQFEKAGIESALAESLALLPVLGASFEMIRLSQESKADVLTVAKHYFVLGNRLSLDWIRDQGKLLKMDDYWQAIAVNGMIDDLYSAQAYIIRQVIQDEKKAMKKGEEPKKIIARWMNGHETFVLQFDEHMAMMKRLNNINLAHLTIAAQKIRHLGDF